MYSKIHNNSLYFIRWSYVFKSKLVLNSKKQHKKTLKWQFDIICLCGRQIINIPNQCTHYWTVFLFTQMDNQNQNQKPFNVPQTGKFFFVATAEYYKEYYLCFTSPQWQTFQHDPILGKPAYRSSTDQITKAVQRHSPCIQSLHVTHKQQPLCIPKPLNQSKMKVISHKHLL